jgi:hypothetical protein
LQKQQLLTGLSLNILDGVSLVPILLHQDPCEEHYQIRDHLWSVRKPHLISRRISFCLFSLSLAFCHSLICSFVR